jgi:hypothetical protein
MVPFGPWWVSPETETFPAIDHRRKGFGHNAIYDERPRPEIGRRALTRVLRGFAERKLAPRLGFEAG